MTTTISASAVKQYLHNPAPFYSTAKAVDSHIAITLVYSWKHPRKGKEVDKIQAVLFANSPQHAIAQAKAAATNLGITVNVKSVKQILSNKYEKPHQGRKEIERRLRRARAEKDKAP